VDETAPAASRPRRLTARGAATRLRIVRATSDLIRARGVGATTMEDAAAASGASKSQLYYHFADKDELVQAVIDLRGQELLELHGELLVRAHSIRGLERWRDVVVGRVAAVHGAHGCALGSIATEIAEDNDRARATLVRYFSAWERQIASALQSMIDQRQLAGDADAQVLAQQVMAALQGGYLLSQVERSEEPMRRALEMALDQIRRAVPAGAEQRPR
jgi:TetR/AcrR family transcriptional regulator, transcriptional repressor for nem operon